MSTRTAEQTRLAEAFHIERIATSTSQHTYMVSRLNRGVAWPDNATLLLACDDGWDAVFEKQTPRHFGGRVTPTSPDAARVVVYVD